MSTKKLLISIVAGAAVGSILGILFAPAKGSLSRKRIARTGTNYIQDVEEKFFENISSISDEFNTAKDSAIDLVDKAKKKASSVVGIMHVK